MKKTKLLFTAYRLFWCICLPLSLWAQKSNLPESIPLQKDSLSLRSIGEQKEPQAVVLGNDTLFYITHNLGPFLAADRAENIEKKLQRLAQGVFDPEKLELFDSENGVDLLYGTEFLLSITPKDAREKNLEAKALGKQYLKQIGQGIQSYQAENGIKQSLIRMGLLALVLLIFFFVVKYLNKGFTWINRRLIRKSSAWIKRVRIKNYDFLSQEQGERILAYLLKILKWMFIALLVYLLLPIVFSIFPSTKSIAHQLFGYVLTPLKNFALAVVRFLPNLFAISVIFFLTRLFVRLLRFLAAEVESSKLEIPGFYNDWARPTYNLLKIIVYAFSFIVIFPYLPGSDSPVFQGVSVFLGLLISLGSSSAIGNLIAGLVITYMRPFKIGDRVKIGEVTGDVMEKTMLVTRIRTIKNEDVSIPNASILSGSTINYSSSAKSLGWILHSTITIGYDVHWRSVHQLLIDSALKTEWVLHTPAPFVLQQSLDDFYVSYQINAYTHEAGKAAGISSELHSHIQDAFTQAGIEIMSPHYRANRDGNDATIPS